MLIAPGEPTEHEHFNGAPKRGAPEAAAARSDNPMAVELVLRKVEDQLEDLHPRLQHAKSTGSGQAEALQARAQRLTARAGELKSQLHKLTGSINTPSPDHELKLMANRGGKKKAELEEAGQTSLFGLPAAPEPAKVEHGVGSPTDSMMAKLIEGQMAGERAQSKPDLPKVEPAGNQAEVAKEIERQQAEPLGRPAIQGHAPRGSEGRRARAARAEGLAARIEALPGGKLPAAETAMAQFTSGMGQKYLDQAEALIAAAEGKAPAPKAAAKEATPSEINARLNKLLFRPGPGGEAAHAARRAATASLLAYKVRKGQGDKEGAAEMLTNARRHLATAEGVDGKAAVDDDPKDRVISTKRHLEDPTPDRPISEGPKPVAEGKWRNGKTPSGQTIGQYDPPEVVTMRERAEALTGESKQQAHELISTYRKNLTYILTGQANLEDDKRHIKEAEAQGGDPSYAKSDRRRHLLDMERQQKHNENIKEELQKLHAAAKPAKAEWKAPVKGASGYEPLKAGTQGIPERYHSAWRVQYPSDGGMNRYLTWGEEHPTKKDDGDGTPVTVTHNVKVEDAGNRGGHYVTYSVDGDTVPYQRKDADKQLDQVFVPDGEGKVENTIREAYAKYHGKLHKAAPRSSKIILVKSASIKGGGQGGGVGPPLILMPSKTDPTVRRWQSPADGETREQFTARYRERRDMEKHHYQAIASQLPGQTDLVTGRITSEDQVKAAKARLGQIQKEEESEQAREARKQDRKDSALAGEQHSLFGAPAKPAPQDDLFAAPKAIPRAPQGLFDEIPPAPKAQGEDARAAASWNSGLVHATAALRSALGGELRKVGLDLQLSEDKGEGPHKITGEISTPWGTKIHVAYSRRDLGQGALKISADPSDTKGLRAIVDAGLGTLPIPAHTPKAALEAISGHGPKTFRRLATAIKGKSGAAVSPAQSGSLGLF